MQNIIELEDGNSVLKLTVASYYRPSGKNIHRFKNAKATDEWGVSPDKGLEVKLAPSEFMQLVRGPPRPRPGVARAKGHRKPAAPGPPPRRRRTRTSKGEQEGRQGRAEERDGKAGAKAKAKSAHRPAGPFVDKQLDKALEVIKAKLAEPKPRRPEPETRRPVCADL